MANFDQLKQSVAALIRTNGAEEITGQIMQDVLLTIINSISGGYMFGGVAQHNGNVGNPDYNVFYLAGSGAYTGYGGAITIEDGCYGVFRYNGSWTQEVVDIGVRLSGSVTEGETRGCTGDTINTALQTLFNNVMDILDTLTFTYNTPSAQQATKAMLDVIMTPTGGAPHVFATLTLASATVAAAGLMSAEDKQKVDRMLTDFRSLSLTDTTAAADQATKIVQTLSATLGENPEAITTMTFLAATASKAGLMSAADKAVLDCMVAMLGYYECPTAADTDAKVVSASGYSLTNGGCIRIKMTNANTAANVTLNINSTGAKALYYDGAQASSTNTWEAGEVLEVYYDGTQYQCASGGGGKFATGEKVKEVSITDTLNNTSALIEAAPVKEAVDNINENIEDDEFSVAKALVNHEERIAHIEDTEIGEDEEFVIAQALTDLNRNETEEQEAETVKIEILTTTNSDTIEVVSSSYGAGNHEVHGKNWVAKLSLFSDFYFTNNSWDGANNTAHLKSLRAGGKDGHKYALCVCMENNPADMTANVQMRDIENLCRTYIGMGVTPIVGTQYSYTPSHDMCTIINHYAEQNKLVFADLYYYCRYLAATLARSMFDLGSHLGTRNATIMSDFYGRVLDFLPRPMKSMKIFKLRSSYTTNNLDELVFITNEQRAKRFMELNFVSWGLADISTVDNGPNPGTQYPNEYSLINSSGVVFTSAALVSAVLPYTSHNLSKVAFAAKFIGNVHVYVRNVAAGPYPVEATYVRFTVMNSSITTPSQNDVYSDGTNNYTVYMTIAGENGSNYTLYCTGTFNEGDPQTGNLTKVSGAGPSTIPYALREQVTLSGASVILADNCGHWVEVPNTNGEYDATPFIKNSMDIDKIHFLITGDNFTMISPKIYYSGNGSKVYQYTVKEFHYNEDNLNDELIQESVFGAVGSELTYWTDDNGDAITTESTYEDVHGITNCHPTDCDSVVNVTDTYAMKQSVSASVTRVAPLTLEIWCRYFPPVYTDGSGNQITEDSYDYNTLQVSVGGVTMEENISTAWGKYQFTIKDLKRFSTVNQYIRISAANSYGIQIGKVSLKYKI